jgi:hypothetical protein
VPLEDVIRRGVGDRFHFYAQRVRSLQFNEHDHGRHRHIVSPPVLEHWAVTRSMFPLCNRLSIKTASRVLGPQHVLNLFRPCLTELYLDAYGIQYDAISAAHASGVFRQLTKLDFGVGNTKFQQIKMSDTAWQDLLIDIVSTIMGLRQLEIRIEIRPKDLVVISQLPELSDLNLKQGIPSIPGCLPSEPKPFMRLRWLSIDEAMSCAQVIPFLSFYPSVLEDVWLAIDQVSSTSELVQLAQELAHHTQLQMVIFLSFTCVDGFRLTAEQTLEFLQPFRALKQLEHLWTPSDFTFPISHSSFLELFSSWPCLLGFDINFSDASHPSRSLVLSLHEFFSFLRAHPKLSILPCTIGISTSVGEPLSDFPSASQDNQPSEVDPLRDVAVVEDLAALQQLLKQHFPQVDIYRLWWVECDQNFAFR